MTCGDVRDFYRGRSGFVGRFEQRKTVIFGARRVV